MSMSIASLIVRVKAGSAEQATALIEAVDGLSVHTVTEKNELIVLAEAPSPGDITALGHKLEALEPVSSVTLSYIGSDK